MTARFAFAASSLDYHLDGDNTISLMQANDWLSTPNRAYFWDQDYMGTSEVWLFSSLWRLLFGAQAKIPLLYWVFCSQLLYSVGAALVLAGLVFTERSFWGRGRVFALALVVFGVGVPVFEKYTFGVGHGYSAVPFYAGITIFFYLCRERLNAAMFLLAGIALGQAHYTFRLHIIYPAALALALLSAWPRRYALRVGALGIGVVLGMLPEKLLLPPQGYSATLCLHDLGHMTRNLSLIATQAAVHVGTLPYSLLESEHAFYFLQHRPLPDACVYWGERIGAVLLIALCALELRRQLRSRRYAIFIAILAANIGALTVNCVPLDPYSARRYMYTSLFSIGFLLLSPPWTLLSRFALVLRIVPLPLYVASALSFHMPLSDFASSSTPLDFDEERDCLAGFGADLSSLIALNDLRVQTVDIGWRLRGQYSRNVDATPEAVRAHCRQLFWVVTRKTPKKLMRRLCARNEEYYQGQLTGLVSYPAHVSFQRCVVPQPKPSP